METPTNGAHNATKYNQKDLYKGLVVYLAWLLDRQVAKQSCEFEHFYVPSMSEFKRDLDDIQNVLRAAPLFTGAYCSTMFDRLTELKKSLPRTLPNSDVTIKIFPYLRPVLVATGQVWKKHDQENERYVRTLSVMHDRLEYVLREWFEACHELYALEQLRNLKQYPTGEQLVPM